MDRYIDYFKALRENNIVYKTVIDSDVRMKIILDYLLIKEDTRVEMHLVFTFSKLSNIYINIKKTTVSEIPNFIIQFCLSKFDNKYLWSDSLFELVNLFEPPADYKNIRENLNNIIEGYRGFKEFYNILIEEYKNFTSNNQLWLEKNASERLYDPFEIEKNSVYTKIDKNEYNEITNLEIPKNFIEFELLIEFNEISNLLKLIVKNPENINLVYIKNFLIPKQLDYSIKDLIIDIENKLLDKVPVNEIGELDAGSGVKIFEFEEID